MLLLRFLPNFDTPFVPISNLPKTSVAVLSSVRRANETLSLGDRVDPSCTRFALLIDIHKSQQSLDTEEIPQRDAKMANTISTSG
jgi:hypothetical protein